MSERREGVGAAVLDNLLYAVGGRDGWTYLNSVERYHSFPFSYFRVLFLYFRVSSSYSRVSSRTVSSKHASYT
ncbi:kelch repeat protein [Cooperia oncophora]